MEPLSQLPCTLVWLEKQGKARVTRFVLCPSWSLRRSQGLTAVVARKGFTPENLCCLDAPHGVGL